jgi:hypothetical protein
MDLKPFKIAIVLLLVLCGVAVAGPQETSSTTASTIITNARYLLNDNESPYNFDDSWMLQWLNDAVAKVPKRSRGYQATENIDLIASQLEYTPTQDYTSIEAVVYLNADGLRKALERGSPAELGKIYDVQEPVKWYEFNGKIGIYPLLSSVTTEKVTVYMNVRPDALAITDTIETPAIFDTALTWYIVAQALWQDRKYTASQQAMARFDNELYQARVELNMTPEPNE